jgi:ATP-dependent helicase HrpB
LHCAANWLPEYDWPAVDDDSLLETLERWLLPQMSGVHSLRAESAGCGSGVTGLLDWSLRNVWIVNCRALHCADRKPDCHSLS